jgi:hypothetical protein
MQLAKNESDPTLISLFRVTVIVTVLAALGGCTDIRATQR